MIRDVTEGSRMGCSGQGRQSEDSVFWSESNGRSLEKNAVGQLPLNGSGGLRSVSSINTSYHALVVFPAAALEVHSFT